MVMDNIFDTIKNYISQNKVVLFMKGDKNAPLCGFSKAVVDILESMEVDFKDVDVMQSEEMRQGIKDYSDWGTVPQLYINEEFIGGADIVEELYKNGELEKLINTSVVS